MACGEFKPVTVPVNLSWTVSGTGGTWVADTFRSSIASGSGLDPTSGASTCPETSSIPNLTAPSQYKKVDKEFKPSCRNEQAIYELLENYESKGMRVYQIHGPAWLARVARGMKDFESHKHPNAVIGWIYGAEVLLDSKLDEKLRVVAYEPGAYICSCARRLS